MSRNISFSLTISQFLDGSKDVTRRMGWEFLKPGDVLCAVEKSQGLKKGEKVKRLGKIRVRSAKQEPLNTIASYPDDVEREGFPQMGVQDFIAFFCGSHKGCKADTVVTRIEYERLA